MIALSELHYLIHSLSKSEKRFFKLVAGTQNLSSKAIVQLFDLIESIEPMQDAYSVLQNHNDVISTQNMSDLYNYILKSQRGYHVAGILSFNMNNDLADLHVLFEKAQFKQCAKMLIALKNKAISKEEFGILIELIELEKKLLLLEHTAYNKNNYNHLIEEQEKYLTKDKNLSEYYKLYSTIKSHLKNKDFKKQGTQSEYYASVLKNTILTDNKKPHSKKASLLQKKCRALAFTALKKQDFRKKELLGITEFFDENSFVFEEMPRQLIDTLYNLSNLFIETKDFNRSKEVLKKMKALLTSKKIIGHDLKLKLETYCYIVELLILTYSGKFTATNTIAADIMEFLYESQNTINKEDKSIILFNLINFCIYTGNYSKAEKLLEIQIADSDRKGRIDIRYYSRFQQLIVMSELDKDLSISLVLDELNEFKEYELFNTAVEKSTIQFFRNYKGRNSPEYRENLKDWFTSLSNSIRNKQEAWSNFFYINTYAYCGSKIGKGTIQELIIQNHKFIETH
ncbi:MAG: hypothetical protein IPM51_15085 [Sphingobacteriaceae bacterium]|nr:hypothetical protein [Sphingobacteriaceae bacterium]